jgi:hypothetical protein
MPSTGLLGRKVAAGVQVSAAQSSRGIGLVPQARAAVSLRYVRTAPMRLVGAISGRQYEFSGSRPTQAIDSRDMFQLLSTGYFSRA